MAAKAEVKNLTEEMITEVTLSTMNKNPNGETNYPILEFDEYALALLSTGVHETLKYSEVKANGGAAYAFIKRLADIILSFLAIVVLFIPMAIIALLVFLQDRGNPFFSQARLTKDGKVFRMYKFRSMCIDAEEKFAQVQQENETDGIAFKNTNDPRITKIGGFLRKTSLDELPQLWNVLAGDMSIIGPRPPLPREVVLYTPAHMERLIVKGGLSCIAQCEGRSDVEFEKWVKSDVEYIKSRSLWLDIKLIIRTIVVVIMKKGAK
ncbi:MAG: sugar transferase [Ruminococcus sp.]|nr:sugar transferase [Ruminococcus sp.]